VIGIFYQNGEAVAPFSTFMQQDFTNQNSVAFEPLEQGRWSSDSKQPNPNIVFVLATQSILFTIDEIYNTVNICNTLCNGTDLLDIAFLYNSYINMTMTSFNYSITPEKPVLFANMTFQNIRMTQPQYGKQPLNKTKNPLNASPQNRGLQQGNGTDNSVLNKYLGSLP